MIPPNHSSYERAWARVGQIATVVGTLVGVLLVFRECSRPEAELTLTAVAYPYAPVPTRSDSVRASDWVYLSSIEGLLVGTITNEGDRPARDVTLTVPFARIARFANGGSTQVTQLDPSRIEIGTILPKASVTVAVWTSTTPQDYWREDTQLSHADGTGTVSLGYTLHGWQLWIYTRLRESLSGLVIVLILGAPGALVVLVVQYAARHFMGNKTSKNSGQGQVQEHGD